MSQQKSMKKIWVVSLKTSLPDLSGSLADLKTTARAFDNFEAARRCARATIKKLAFGKENVMFDGKGHLKNLDEYAEYYRNYIEDPDEEDYVRPKDFVKMIRDFLAGKDTAFSKIADGYCGEEIEISVNPEELTAQHDDGGCFSTNMLAMYKNRPYHLYIDDNFGRNNLSSKLYLDVLPVDLKEGQEKT